MGALERFFSELGSLEDYPDPDDSILDELENWLVFALDSDVRMHFSQVFDWVSHHVRSLAESTESNEKNIQIRLLKLMKVFRPNLLTVEQSRLMQDIFTDILFKATDERRNHAFVALIDHAISSPVDREGKMAALLEFLTGYIGRAADNFPEVDLNFAFLIVQNYRNLIAAPEKSVIMLKVPAFASELTRLVEGCLRAQTRKDYFPSMALLTAKGLRLLARFIESSTSIDRPRVQLIDASAISKIAQFRTLIPDDVRFCRIHENFLLCLCFIMRTDERKKDPTAVEYLMKYMAAIMPVLSQPPFNKSRRVIILIKEYCNLCKAVLRRGVNDMYEGWTPNVWPMIGNLQLQTNHFVCNVVDGMVSPETLKDNPGMLIEIWSNLCGVLQMMQSDLTLGDLLCKVPIETDVWLESTRMIIDQFVRLAEIYFKTQRIDTAVLFLFGKVISYICFVADRAGHAVHQSGNDSPLAKLVAEKWSLKEFHDRINKQLIVRFCQVFRISPPAVIQTVLFQNLQEMLPTKPHHFFHRYMHTTILENLKELGTLDGLRAYYTVFFRMISSRFDALFLAEPEILCELTYQVFSDAFTGEHKPIGQTTAQGQTQPSQPDTYYMRLCDDLYNFVLKSIFSKNTTVLKLLLKMFCLVFEKKDSPPLQPFLSHLQKCPFSMPHVLAILADDPELEISISTLALFLFPLCVSNQPADQWVTLFLPALESKKNQVLGMHALYTYAWKLFARILNQLKPANRIRLVSAVAEVLNMQSEKDCKRANYLLSIAIDTSLSVASYPLEPKKNGRCILLDGRKVNVELISETIRKQEKTTEDDGGILCDLYIQSISSMEFVDCVTDKQLDATVAFTCEKFPEVLRAIPDSQFAYPQLYSHIYYKYKYFRDGWHIREIEDFSDNYADLLQYCCLVSTHKLSAEIAATLIGDVLSVVPLRDLSSTSKSNVPIHTRVISALMHGSIYAYRTVKTIIREHALLSPGNDVETKKLMRSLCDQFAGFAVLHPREYQKIAIMAMKHYEHECGMECSSERSRIDFISNIPLRLEKNQYTTLLRLEFVTMYPLSEKFPEPKQFLVKLFELLMSDASAISVVRLPTEVENAVKNVMFKETATMNLAVFRFILKIIVKFMVALKPDADSTTLWERLLHMLRKDKYRSQFDVFKKYLDKELKRRGEEKVNSIWEPLKVFNNTSRTMPAQGSYSTDDIIILRFIYKYSKQLPTTEILVWIYQYLVTCRTLDGASIVELFLLIKDIYNAAPTLRFKDCIMVVTELAIGRQGASLPIHLLLDDMPEMIFTAFKESALKKFTMGHATFIIRLFLSRQLVAFRNVCLESAIRELPSLIAFLDRQDRYIRNFAISYALSSMWRLVKEKGDGEVNIAAVMELMIQLLSTARDKYEKQFSSPSAVIGFMTVFLPISYAADFTSGSEIADMFVSRIVPLIMSLPGMFNTDVFVRRFIYFLGQLPDDVREAALDRACNAETDTIEKKIFCLEIVSQRLRHFHPEGTFEYTVGFAGFPMDNKFTAFKLNAAGLQIALEKDTVVTDIEDCKLFGSDWFVDLAGIVSGVMAVGDCATMTRLAHISKVLITDHSDTIDSTALASVFMAKMDNAMCTVRGSSNMFRIISMKVDYFDMEVPGIMRYGISATAASVTNKVIGPDRSVVYGAPFWLDKLLEKEYTFCVDRIAELCLMATDYFIRRPIVIGGNFPHVIEAHIKKIQMGMQEQMIDNICTSLMAPHDHVPGQPRDAQMERLVCKFSLQVIPIVAQRLYKRGKAELPWSFKQFFDQMFWQSKEWTGLFQYAMQESSRHVGIEPALLVVEMAYDRIKGKFKRLTAPLPDPYATVAAWMNEVSDTKDGLMMVKVLLESVKPMTVSSMLHMDKHLKLPVHCHVYEHICDMVNAMSEESRNLLSNCRAITKFMMPAADDPVLGCWYFNWFSVEEESHLTMFLRLMMPTRTHHLLKLLDDKESVSIVSTLLSDLLNTTGFNEFFEFYRDHFPHSSLAECGWSVSQVPDPAHFRKRYDYFFTNGLCDDALGLLKDNVPVLSNAVSYHQVGNYRAAHAYYLRAMDEHPSECYFHAMTELQRVHIMMSLPTTDKLFGHILKKKENNAPHVVLPFINEMMATPVYDLFKQEGLRQMEYTSRFSQVYIPSLLRAALSEEVFTSINALMQKSKGVSNSINDIRRPFLCQWMKSFDKQTAFASAMTWRLNILQDMSEGQAHTHPPQGPSPLPGQVSQDPLKDMMKHNLGLLSRLLMKVGATKHSMKALYLSEQVATQQTTKHPSVTPKTLPRAVQLIEERPQGGYMLFRFNTHIALRAFTSRWIMPVIQKTHASLSRQWIMALVAVQSINPDLIDPVHIFTRIYNEMMIPSSNKVNVLMAICMCLIRRRRECIKPFFDKVLDEKLSEDVASALVRWIPEILSHCGVLPVEFMRSIVKFTGDYAHFQYLITHSKLAGLVQNTDFVQEFQQKYMAQTEISKLNEAYRDSMAWINLYRPQIDRLKMAAENHVKFYEMLASTDEISESDILDFAGFCSNHSLVMSTDNDIPVISSTAGFRFPMVSHSVIAITIKSDGVNEGKLRVLTANGEHHTFELISSHMYPFSYSELLFVESVRRMIENHQTSKGRCKFLTYPTFFLIDKDLILSMSHNQGTFSQKSFVTSDLPRLFAAAALNGERDDSPHAVRSRKAVDVDRDFYLNFFIQGANGLKMDFFYTRQCFASHFAAFMALRFLSGAKIPYVPTLNLYEDRVHVSMPGFLRFDNDHSPLPITQAIRRLLPDFVLKGSFTTTWHGIMEVMTKQSEKIKLILEALIPKNATRQDVERWTKRAQKLAMHVSPETEKLDDPFPFMLLDHMIDSSENSLNAYYAAYSWI